MTLFSVTVGRSALSIDSAATNTLTLDGVKITDPAMREIVLVDLITNMATEMVNRTPSKEDVRKYMQPPQFDQPPALRAVLNAMLVGKIGPVELRSLREHAPRFVEMLENGLDKSRIGLREMAETGMLNTDMIERAMR